MTASPTTASANLGVGTTSGTARSTTCRPISPRPRVPRCVRVAAGSPVYEPPLAAAAPRRRGARRHARRPGPEGGEAKTIFASTSSRRPSTASNLRAGSATSSRSARRLPHPRGLCRASAARSAHRCAVVFGPLPASEFDWTFPLIDPDRFADSRRHAPRGPPVRGSGFRRTLPLQWSLGCPYAGVSSSPPYGNVREETGVGDATQRWNLAWLTPYDLLSSDALISEVGYHLASPAPVRQHRPGRRGHADSNQAPHLGGHRMDSTMTTPTHRGVSQFDRDEMDRWPTRCASSGPTASSPTSSRRAPPASPRTTWSRLTALGEAQESWRHRTFAARRGRRCLGHVVAAAGDARVRIEPWSGRADQGGLFRGQGRSPVLHDDARPAALVPPRPPEIVVDGFPDRACRSRRLDEVRRRP